MKLAHLFLLFVILFCIPFAFLGCDTGDDDDGDDDVADDDDDDQGDYDPEGRERIVLPQFFKDRPWLQDRSLWHMHIQSASPPLLRKYGELGLGNGRCFALLSANAPLNTLHNISGPDYERGLRFFSDKPVRVWQNSQPLRYVEEWAWRVRRTAINITRSNLGTLDLWTVDFAPLVPGEGTDSDMPLDAIVRIFVVHNSGATRVKQPLLTQETVLGQAAGNMLYEESEDKQLYVAHAEGSGWIEEGRKLAVPLPDLAPGEEAVVPLVFVFAKGGASPQYVLDTVADTGAEVLLDLTRDCWFDWYESGATLQTPDQRFNDLIEGLQVTIRAQQTDKGASCVMSEYSGTWTRDIMGPVVFLTPFGRLEDAESIVDYHWGAILLRGNMSNSYDADLDLGELPPQPDWESKPTMHGRTGAETPSYVVLQYRELYRATGDIGRIAERYGLLKHCIVHQDFREGCLLPFSDDETYRLLMQAAYGLWIGDSMYDTQLSSNSSFLFVPAAEFMAEIATELGFDDDAILFTQLADQVRVCTEDRYWVDHTAAGFYASIIDIDTLEPWEQPYEDVVPKGLWMGYADGTDDHARESMLTLVDWCGRDDGTAISYTHSMYELLMDLMDVYEGIYSGMSQGYVLQGLTAIDHPRAEQLFLYAPDLFNNGGNVSEAQVADDHGRFAYLWEPFGFVCDLTSRYRPWEGGIFGDALLDYLFGYRPDAPAGRISITSHLPSTWEYARVAGLTYGDGGVDIDVSESKGTRTVEVRADGVSFAMELNVSVSGDITGLKIDGVEQDLAEYQIDSEWGISRITVSDVPLSAGDEVSIRVSHE